MFDSCLGRACGWDIGRCGDREHLLAIVNIIKTLPPDSAIVDNVTCVYRRWRTPEFVGDISKGHYGKGLSNAFKPLCLSKFIKGGRGRCFYVRWLQLFIQPLELDHNTVLEGEDVPALPMDAPKLVGRQYLPAQLNHLIVDQRRARRFAMVPKMGRILVKIPVKSSFHDCGKPRGVGSAHSFKAIYHSQNSR